MYFNAKHVAPAAILVLILCVLNTDQTLFSRKKTTSAAPPADGYVQPTGPIPQKESSHWWQVKHPVEIPAASSSSSDSSAGSNQVAVAIPLHQKLQSFFESHVNSNVKWVPCLCPVRKGEHQLFHHQQQHQQQPQPQQQPQQQQQHQPSQQPYASTYYMPTTTSSYSPDINSVPRFIFANYPIEA